ncbi:MAG: hypothetical protein AAB656_03450 [Patescibacteria group bacterium]
MKQIVRFSIIPGIIVAAVNAFGLWILGALKLIGQGNSLENDIGLGFIAYLFFLYVLTIAISAILTRKSSLILSFIFALLSTLVGEFASSFIVGVSNKSSIGFGWNLNPEIIFGPVLTKYNYMLLEHPVLVLSATLFIVILVKFVFKIIELIKSKSSVGKTKKNSRF